MGRDQPRAGVCLDWAPITIALWLRCMRESRVANSRKACKPLAKLVTTGQVENLREISSVSGRFFAPE